MNRPITRLAYLFVAASALLIAGCQDFVAEQARQSFTSFVTSIVTTAINETLGGN